MEVQPTFSEVEELTVELDLAKVPDDRITGERVSLIEIEPESTTFPEGSRVEIVTSPDRGWELKPFKRFPMTTW